jgi:CheY-like chemotaxis protein
MANKKFTIMVVEDEPLLLKAIVHKLNLSDIIALPFHSGQQALKQLESSNIPNAIWLDYYLKDINGLDFATAVKQHRLWANVPIVVVSNSASPDKIESMLALGVKNYLLKAEYRLDDIINIIKKLSTKS